MKLFFKTIIFKVTVLSIQCTALALFVMLSGCGGSGGDGPISDSISSSSVSSSRSISSSSPSIISSSSSMLSSAVSSADASSNSQSSLDNLTAFPPMANDNPPGVSMGALITAQQLGRGVNFGNMLESPLEGQWGVVVSDTIYDDFIAKTVAAGFKTLRLPVRFSNHAAPTEDATIDAEFLTHIERLVDKMLSSGLYVILDIHNYSQFNGDALEYDEVAVESNIVDLRFLNMWSQLAQRFNAKSDHLLLELYNEPHGRLTSDKWNDMAARALGVVRLWNPTRAVIIGPAQWNSAWSLNTLKLPNDSNLIATVHQYDPVSFTHQGAPWITPVWPLGVSCCDIAQQSEITSGLNVAQAWSIANHYPIYLGEFGAYSLAEMSSRVAYSRFVRDEAEARGFTWAYWEFASGFGVYDPENKVFRIPLRDALLGD